MMISMKNSAIYNYEHYRQEVKNAILYPAAGPQVSRSFFNTHVESFLVCIEEIREPGDEAS
jgi:hypothetical protein